MITSVFVTPPPSPVIVTVVDLLTAEDTALNPVVEAPAATTTVDGTFNAALLLVKDTDIGLLAAALSDTEQAFVVAPVIVCVPHEIALNVAAGSDGCDGSRVITSVFVTPPAVPVIVTATDLLTSEETALNPAAVAPF